MTSRIWQVFVGGILVVAGALMLYAFQFVARHGHDTWIDVAGTTIVIEACSIVASLFVLLGFRYAFGPRSFIERSIARTTRHFVAAVILLSSAIAVVGIYLFRGFREDDHPPGKTGTTLRRVAASGGRFFGETSLALDRLRRSPPLSPANHSHTLMPRRIAH